MSVHRSAWSALFLAASLATADAKEVSGAFVDSTSKATLFVNSETANPNAKDATGTAVGSNVKWDIENLTYKDEDTGTEYMEITTTLTAPILDTDTVLFHVEYTSDRQTEIVSNSALNRDGFECKLVKDVSTDYWKTTVKDVYVRGGVDGTVTDDFSNASTNKGQDWFVDTEDKDRESGHLCTGSALSDIQCASIKCIVRRALTNADADDMQFKPDTAQVNKMTFPKLKSWIMLNQSTLTAAKQKVLETQIDKDITILASAIMSATFSVATSIAALTAFTFF